MKKTTSHPHFDVVAFQANALKLVAKHLSLVLSSKPEDMEANIDAYISAVDPLSMLVLRDVYAPVKDSKIFLKPSLGSIKDVKMLVTRIMDDDAKSLYKIMKTILGKTILKTLIAMSAASAKDSACLQDLKASTTALQSLKLLVTEISRVKDVLANASRIAVAENTDAFKAWLRGATDLLIAEGTLVGAQFIKHIEAAGLKLEGTKKPTKKDIDAAIKNIDLRSWLTNGSLLKNSVQHLVSVVSEITKAFNEHSELSLVGTASASSFQTLDAIAGQHKLLLEHLDVWQAVVQCAQKSWPWDLCCRVKVEHSEILFSTAPFFVPLGKDAKWKAYLATFLDVTWAQSHAQITSVATEFQKQSLVEQTLWTVPKTTKVLLPPMSFSEKSNEDVAALEDAFALASDYRDEKDERVMHFLKGIATYMRPQANQVQYKNALSVLRPNSTEQFNMQAIVQGEKLRAGAAKFLVERGTCNASSFLKSENVPKVGEIEMFLPKEDLMNSVKVFFQDLEASKRLLGLTETETHQGPHMADLKLFVADGSKLYLDKTMSIFSGLQGASLRLADHLDSCLVDWRPYVCVSADIARIKRELLGNEAHSKILPYIKSIRTAIDFLGKVGSIGYDFSGVTTRLVKLETQGKEQLAASAACVALYITSQSTGKPSSKASAMRAAKTLITSLGIQLPMDLTARLTQEISKQDKLAKLTPSGKS